METPNTLRPDIEAEALPDTIAPSDFRSVFQAGQFLLMLLAACYFAGEIILPIVLAFVLSLVLQPLMRLLEKLHLPRSLAALAIIMVLGGSIIGLGAALSGPAVSWAQKLPEGLPRLQERLSFLKGPIESVRQFLEQADAYAHWGSPPTTASDAQGGSLSQTLFAGTRNFATGLFTTVLLLFFLLISGDTFLRRLVEILPDFSDKRQAVNIFQQIEADISAYLVTITIMNAGVGIAVGAVKVMVGVTLLLTVMVVEPLALL
jgi:predicted PurR-regulated permease PerM